MSYQWVYSGHQDDSAKIIKIYCSRIVRTVPAKYIWLVKTKDGEEKSLGAYKITDFDNSEDIKAFNYAVTNSSQLDQKELQNYLDLSARN
jgi:hypothetical protein